MVNTVCIERFFYWFYPTPYIVQLNSNIAHGRTWYKLIVEETKSIHRKWQFLNSKTSIPKIWYECNTFLWFCITSDGVIEVKNIDDQGSISISIQGDNFRYENGGFGKAEIQKSLETRYKHIPPKTWVKLTEVNLVFLIIPAAWWDRVLGGIDR